MVFQRVTEIRFNEKIMNFSQQLINSKKNDLISKGYNKEAGQQTPVLKLSFEYGLKSYFVFNRNILFFVSKWLEKGVKQWFST